MGYYASHLSSTPFPGPTSSRTIQTLQVFIKYPNKMTGLVKNGWQSNTTVTETRQFSSEKRPPMDDEAMGERGVPRNPNPAYMPPSMSSSNTCQSGLSSGSLYVDPEW